MKRRDFITLLGGTAAAWPLTVHGQDQTKRVAVLMGIAQDDPEGQARMAAFQQGLRDLGWQEGRNLRIETRWGTGDASVITTYAAELVSLAPDVILATNTPTARALKQVTATIPVVFAGLTDPIGDGVVASLSRPGANITGFTSFNAEIAGKWLELMKEVAPETKRAAVIFNPKTAPYAIFLPVMEAVAPKVGLTLAPAPVSQPVDIAASIGKLAGVPRAGLVIIPDVFSAVNRETIFALATRSKVPTVCPVSYFARDGGVLAYGSNFPDLFRQSASYINRILRGEKPFDLPVQDPTKYELVINLKAARAIGLSVPPLMLARADEVIE
jgi:putative tryptophan/tyrosine transport system substrate-binding protein